MADTWAEFHPSLFETVSARMLDPIGPDLQGGNHSALFYWTKPAMPRQVRDSNLETRTARNRLKVAHKPYFRLIEPGLHIGYRKLANGPGTWVVRRYSGQGRYSTKNLLTPDGGLVVADDFSEPDGHSILSFAQAQERGKAFRFAVSDQGSGTLRLVGPYMVRDAMNDYLAFLQSEGRSDAAIADTRYRNEAFIKPKLGDLELSSLTADKLRHWRDAVAKSAPRLRTKHGEKQKHREVGKDDEAHRARRASANRTWTTLRAALNRAFENDKVDSDRAWRKVKPFKGVDKARARYLTLAEAERLMNASDLEFRPILHGALFTGGRWGQLAQLVVSDFDPGAGTMRMRTRKGDGSEKVYYVYLTPEAIQFFKQACAARNGSSDLIFKKADGTPWRKSHQARPIEEAWARAKINPPANFHVTRHTWASHAVMNLVPLLVVARSLGHSDTRMVERHYGHLAPSYVADAIRAGAPRFGAGDSDVTSLASSGRKRGSFVASGTTTG
jgi:integrase